MTNALKIAGAAVGGLVVGLLLAFAVNAAPFFSGVYNQVNTYFKEGATLGDRTVLYESGTIGAGANQAAYYNNTGRTLYINSNDIHMGWTSGTASSSIVFYVSTSTASSVTDYARPTGTYLLIDGATFATSSPAVSISTGTTTDAGAGAITLAPNEYLIFNVQEQYACKTIGACETATSSNRGIASFFWNFKATYIP